MYHQVDTPVSCKEKRFCVPPHQFHQQITWLSRAGYRFVSLEDILNHVIGRIVLQERAVHISFDDGFVGVLEHAWPLLKAYQIPATLFALPGRLGKINDWMAQRGLPKRALLSGEQLSLLAQEGLTIGSHTCTHPRLTELPLQQAKQEIFQSKQELEIILGHKVTCFAYPYGLFNDQIRELVMEAGYLCACSTRAGFNRQGEDPFLLRRIDIYGTDNLWRFRQKLMFGSNESGWLYSVKYYKNRLITKLSSH
jgi:peptidoglycan/xylan/chitin deacetylase (PgdA/CDA1 family)